MNVCVRACVAMTMLDESFKLCGLNRSTAGAVNVVLAIPQNRYAACIEKEGRVTHFEL